MKYLMRQEYGFCVCAHVCVCAARMEISSHNNRCINFPGRQQALALASQQGTSMTTGNRARERGWAAGRLDRDRVKSWW